MSLESMPLESAPVTVVTGANSGIGRAEGEPADGSLSTFVVFVEEIDRHSPAVFDGLVDLLESSLGGIAKSALPEPDVASRDVDVSGQTVEGLRVAMQGVAGL
jgi:NAD(P)-dependent dehydrogenase (short-subunit alcohol dehydrogenase family)